MLATIAYLQKNNYNGIDDIKELRSDFWSVGISVSYDPILSANGTRKLIFTSTKGMRTQKFDKIACECNGLILEAPTWNILNVPTPTPLTSVNNTVLNRLLTQNKYNIYKIIDGTMIYLYHWEGKWYISTARGLDMENVQINGHSYIDLLTDVINIYGHSFNSFTDLLDIEFSYAFIICNNKIHPFVSNINSITFVHKANQLDGNYNINRDAHGISLNIPYQYKLTTTIKMRDLYSTLSAAVSNWNNEQEPLFGYLLIAKTNLKQNMEHYCVLLESSLLRQIRQFIYDKKFMDYGAYRELASIIAAYISPKRQLFLDMFPIYSEAYKIIEDVQKDTVNNIYAKLITGEILNPLNDQSSKRLEILNNVGIDPIEYLTECVRKKLTLTNIKPEDARTHIYNIINDATYINIHIHLYEIYMEINGLVPNN